MPFNITAGFDTVINNGAGLVPIVQPALTYFEEDPDSPTLEFAEQCTVTHKYHGDWQTIQTLIVSRGTYLIDSFGYLYRVLSCTIAHQSGNAGSMTIVTESISFNVPPDEFDVEAVEFNPALEKFPAYSVLTDTDFANIQSALELPQEAARAEAFAAMCKKAGIDGVLSPNSLSDLWMKFILLASNAGIMAVTRLPIGKLRDDPDIAALFLAAYHEVAAVGRARGIKLPDNAVELVLNFNRVSPPELMASMAVDLLRGNRIELPWLSGKVVELGRQLGVPTPVHTLLYATLKPYILGAPK